MREVFENWFAVHRGICPDEYTKGLALAAFEAAWNHQQAEIDRLMFEFCPDEMTEEQLQKWAEAQRVVSSPEAK